MPQPTTYAGPVGQFIDPATGRMTTQGAERLDNPALGFDTGGIGGVMTMYHGSPHKFPPTPRNPLGEFDPAKIGTGEGAQAYGVGAGYLAELEGLAKGYRDRLSGGTLTYDGAPLGSPGGVSLDGSIKMRINQGMTPQAALKDTLETMRHMGKGSFVDEAERAWSNPDLLRYEKNPGHMYEVRVHADPERFLHWDKRMMDQSVHVQDALRPLMQQDPASKALWMSNPTGEELVRGLPGLESRMSEAGIPGIRYLDQGSRQLPYQIAQSKRAIVEKQNQIAEIQADIDRNPNNMLPAFYSRRRAEIADHQKTIDQINEQMNEGTHNAVVFSPETMEIIRRYGLAAFMAGGGAAALGGGNREQ
jgi:hypothetical protein